MKSIVTKKKKFVEIALMRGKRRGGKRNLPPMPNFGGSIMAVVKVTLTIEEWYFLRTLTKDMAYCIESTLYDLDPYTDDEMNKLCDICRDIFTALRESKECG